MALRIEKLKRRDLRHVLPIEARVFPEPWTVAVFNSELALRHGRLYRAAWDGSELAGYIGFLIVDAEAHITTIAVAPSHQRAGVASALIIDGVRTLLLSGVTSLSLEVAANNEPAQALYRRFGFVPAGVRKNYYPVTGQDAIVMWAYDIDSPEYAERLDQLEHAHRGEESARGD
jgi:ribosomal-protein-alanine N-acetyltransferase